jgi:hypothetical protein
MFQFSLNPDSGGAVEPIGSVSGLQIVKGMKKGAEKKEKKDRKKNL